MSTRHHAVRRPDAAFAAAFAAAGCRQHGASRDGARTVRREQTCATPPRRLPLAALLAATIALVAPAGAQVQQSITNGLCTAEFSIDGTDLWLQSISNDVELRAVSPLAGSGGWLERLVVTSEPEPGAGPTSNDPSQWFEIGPDGLAGWNTAVWNTAPAVVVPDDVVWVVNNAQTALTAVWAGTIDYSEASPSAPLMAYEVVVRWSCPKGEVLPECRLRIELSPIDDGPDAARGGDGSRDTRDGADPALGSVPLLYVSRVRHPIVRLPSFGDPDESLLVPYLGGMLLRDPVYQPFPASFGRAPNAFPVQLAAFSGCEASVGCVEPTCFVSWEGDFGEQWRTLLLGTGTDPLGTGYVELAWETIPERVFTAAQWDAPGSLRAGVITGDWWDAAAAYQDAMVAAAVPWYSGPVSSPANPRPTSVKELAAELFLIPGHEGDNMELASRQLLDATRVLGPNLNLVLYGGYAPDRFDHWLEDGGYLDPGRPSFAGAVSEGQSQFDHLVSPYVNGSVLTDHVEAGIPPTPELLAAHEAMLRDEGFAPNHYADTALAFMCPSQDWWFDWLVDQIVAIADHTGAQGVYLDYFLTGVCYAQHHGAPAGGVGHEPGGGSWMLARRSEQVAALREALGSAFAVSMEFLWGRWADMVDIMHVDVERSIMPSGGWLCCDENGCTAYGDQAACETACGGPCHEEVHPTAFSVPLFRAVHDDVKLSRIIDAPRVSRADRRAWIEAVHVFTFGQIPQITRSEFELWPVFGNRFSFAPYFGYFEPGPGLDASVPGSDEGGGTHLPVAAAASAMDEARFQRFAARLASAVKGYDQDTLFGLPPDDVLGFEDTSVGGGGFSVSGSGAEGAFLHGLRDWHNGAIRRLPDHDVHEVGGPGVVGNPLTVPTLEPVLDDGVSTTTPVYTEVGFLDPLSLPVGDPAFVRSFIPVGMFQAPFDLEVGAAADGDDLGGGTTPVTPGGAPGPDDASGGLLAGGPSGPPLVLTGGSLAFVATNPWISRDLPGHFTLDFSFEPERYPGWSASMPYRVTRTSVLGDVTVEAALNSGTYAVAGHPLEPGDIVWWVFQPLGNAGN